MEHDDSKCHEDLRVNIHVSGLSDDAICCCGRMKNRNAEER